MGPFNIYLLCTLNLFLQPYPCQVKLTHKLEAPVQREPHVHLQGGKRTHKQTLVKALWNRAHHVSGQRT